MWEDEHHLETVWGSNVCQTSSSHYLKLHVGETWQTFLGVSVIMYHKMFLLFPVLLVGLVVSLCSCGFPAGPGFPASIWIWSGGTACRTVSIFVSSVCTQFRLCFTNTWPLSSKRASVSLTLISTQYKFWMRSLVFISFVLQKSSSQVSPKWKIFIFHRLAPVFSLFVPFYLLIPRMPVTQVLGHIHITNKSLVYIVGLQVSLSVDACSSPVCIFCFLLYN